MKNLLENMIKKESLIKYPYKRKPTLLKFKTVSKTKDREHYEFQISAGENCGKHDEILYHFGIRNFLEYLQRVFGEAHLYEFTYDVCDDIGYASYSIVIDVKENE